MKGQTGLMNILRSLALDKKLEDGDQECFIALQHFSLWESGGAGHPRSNITTVPENEESRLKFKVSTVDK